MNVYEKIAEVMKDVTYLAKDGFVETGKGKGYKAITEEKVTSTVRESLIKHGLVIVPVAQSRSTTNEAVVDRYGNNKINHLVELDIEYRVQNVEDPEDYVVAVSSGAGVDTQDKAVGKAMTYSYKYLLLRTFGIPTGEDPDKVSSDIYTEENKPAQTMPETISEQQYKRLEELALSKGQTAEWLLQRCQVDEPWQITKQQYSEVVMELG